MRFDEIGMDIKKVRLNCAKMSHYESLESKIEFQLKDINERASNAYCSNNGSKLNSNCNLIIEAEHCKVRNLKSYRLYTEKSMNKYISVGNSSKEVSKR